MALYSLDQQATCQISLALGPGGHSVHLIGMSPSLIIPPLKRLLNAERMLLGARDTDEPDKLRCELQYHPTLLLLLMEKKEHPC